MEYEPSLFSVFSSKKEDYLQLHNTLTTNHSPSITVQEKPFSTSVFKVLI